MSSLLQAVIILVKNIRKGVCYDVFIVRCYKKNLPVVLYGCETWSLTLREERRLWVFENRRIFGPERDEVTGEWRRLHNKELNVL